MRRSATALPNPSELTVRLETGATTTALVYRASGANAPSAALILGHGAGAGQRSALHGGLRRRAVVDGRGRRHLQFPLHRAGAQDSGSRSGARGLLSRGDRRGARSVSSRRDRRCSSAASRWAGASRRRSPPRIRRCGSQGWCCSDIRCIHRAGRTSAATSTCRRSRGRCCSCRARATHSARRTSSRRFLARLQPPPRLHVVALGDHSFKLSRKDPAAQATVYADVQRAIVSFVSSAP